MTSEGGTVGPAGPGHGLAGRIIEGWALLGGVLLMAIVLVTAYSMAAGAFLGQPVPGDFEIVEVGVAIAAFSFLPYCQLTGANVTADIFTANASRRWVGRFSVLASLIALAFSVIVLWRMGEGMADYRNYGQVTTITQFPIWLAFIPILASLALLAFACVLTLRRSVGEARGRVPGSAWL
jgi:TRAP-type C4-dicarboxylate transport system permease small subunit